MNNFSWIWHEKWNCWEMCFSNGSHFFGTKEECWTQAFPLAARAAVERNGG